MTVDLHEVMEYIYRQIPITVHLGASIREYSGTSLAISAPLDANINHRLSAFGGSLSAIAILSGWALLFIKQKELGIQNTLVIQHSTFDFSDPITDDFDAVAYLPSAETFERFLKMLERKGRARITIRSEIISKGKVCGVHEGVYVAVRG